VDSEQWVTETGIAVPPTRVSRSCIRDTPPSVFWEKRLQGVENKGQGLEKERQGAAWD
jgi:hypothetical protein